MLFVLGVFLCRFVCVELKYQNFPLKWSQSCFQYLSVSSEATTCRLTCTKDRVTPHSLHIIYIYVKGYIYVYIYNHYWIFVSSTWNRKDKQTQLILTLQQKRENKKLCLLVWHIWSTSTAAEPKTLEWRGGGIIQFNFCVLKRAGGHYERKVATAGRAVETLLSVFGGYQVEASSCTLSTAD